MVLTLLFAVISGGLTALLWAGGLSPWWLLPVWIGFYIVTMLVLYALLLGALYLFLPRSNPSPRLRRFTHRLIKWVVRWVLVLTGVRYRVTGADKLPDTPYLLVSNHRSAFDPITSLAAIQSPLVFVAKPGVLTIPILGPLLGRLCFQAIDRENARNAVTTIKRSAELIKDAGLSVGIYPEGTRSKDGTLLPFHAGSFKIAKMANCPVVVATVCYEKRGLWGKRACLHVADVMDVAYVVENNTAAMAERAEAAMREHLGL